MYDFRYEFTSENNDEIESPENSWVCTGNLNNLVKL